MKVSGRIRTLLRILTLVAILMTVAVVSAITTIRLTIHGKQEILPNLVGMQEAQARTVLGGLGLDLDVEDRLYNDKLPVNAIVSQMPAAGTGIKPMQHVHVLLSLGQQKVSVPDLVGRSLRAARITAVQRGLTIGDVAAISWPQDEPNQVVAQDPPPATTDLQSPTVNFLVSVGPQPAAYLCPDFQNKPLGVVRAELQEAGFQNISVTQVQFPGAPQNTIIKQLPLPGSKVTPDTTFEFQVSTQ
ncbi:MAG: PASTA domain-containing protein [Acidobacteriota bacterium]